MKTPKHRKTKVPKEILTPKTSESVAGIREVYTLSLEQLPAMFLHDDLPEQPPPPYDLEERTALFGEAVIRFAKKFHQVLLTAVSLVNWLPQPQASAQTIAKPIMASQAGIFGIRSAPAERKRGKQSSSFAWLLLPTTGWLPRRAIFGKKRKNCT
jgi:hypothetical protein